MKTLLIVVAGLGASYALPCGVLPCALVGAAGPGTETVAPSGDYVEARTASVYAGACHYGSEFTTAGREAILAWRFDEGFHDGIDLAGLSAAALVLGEDNLDLGSTERRALLYVSEAADASEREAIRGWLMSEHAETLGHVVSVEPAALVVQRSGATFAVRVGSTLEIQGETMPERDCCKMPYNVWYDAFETLEDRIVGCAETFRCSEPAVGRSWSSSGDNCVFVGRF